MPVLEVANLVLTAEKHYSPHDQGIRHVATLAGYLSYGLMALTVCFGVLTTTGWARRVVRRDSLYGTHMMLAAIALSFGVIHGIAYVFQTSEHFTWLDAIVPFAGEPEVGFGVLGLEFGIAVAVSIVAQRVMGYRLWHLFHYLAYACFILSFVHVFATSAEVRALELLGIAVFACAGACVLLTVLRFLPGTAVVGARVSPQEV